MTAAPTTGAREMQGMQMRGMRGMQGMRGVRATFGLVLRTQFSGVRFIALLALGVCGLLVAAALGRSGSGDPAMPVEFVDQFGLQLVAPVITLVFAASALGDPAEDGSLVYLWLRPVPRWSIIVGAVGAALLLAWPIVTLTLTGSAVLAGGDGAVALAAALAATVSVVTTAPLFLLIGLTARRALVWGLVYVVLWEGVIASASEGAAQLSVRAYGRSVLAEISGIDLELASVGLARALVVPAVATAALIALATWRLSRQDVA